MEGFNLNALQSLNTLLAQSETQQTYAQQQKDVAPPQTILEINNNRQISTNASKPENQIWAPNEIKNIKIIEDERMEPNYETLYKQNLGAEEVFLNVNDLDPSSVKCQGFIVRVNLPGSFLQEIIVNIEDNNLQVQTPKYNLNYYIPEKIENKKSNVKWYSETYTLEITFVIKKNVLIINQYFQLQQYMNLKNRQNSKFVLLMIIIFSYDCNVYKKKEHLQFVVNKDDQLYIDMGLIHDVNEQMVNIHSNQESVVLPSIIPINVQEYEIPQVDQFIAYDQNSNYQFFLEKGGRSVLIIDKQNQNYDYIGFKKIFQENEHVQCSDIRTATQYAIMLCQDTLTKKLELIMYSSEVDKIIKRFEIENMGFKNPKLSLIFVQNVLDFKIYLIAYDKYDQTQEFSINEEFQNIMITINQPAYQTKRLQFKDQDIKYEIKPNNIRMCMNNPTEARYQILKVKFVLEYIVKIDDDKPYFKYYIVYKEQNKPMVNVVFYQRDLKGDRYDKNPIESSLSNVICHREFCFFIQKPVRFKFFNYETGVLKNHIRLSKQAELVRFYYFQDQYIVIIYQEGNYMSVICQTKTEKCQLYDIQGEDFLTTYQDFYNLEKQVITTFKGTNAKQFELFQSSLLEIDVSKIDIEKGIKIFKEKEQILQIDLRLYNKNELYPTGKDVKVYKKEGSKQNFRVLFPYQPILEELSEQNKLDFDYLNTLSVRNIHQQDQKDFLLHPIINNEIFTYLVKKQMRLYIIENFRYSAKYETSIIDLQLLKSQQNYFLGYNMGNSRRIMGEKIDMSNFSKRGLNQIYDTFVYAPVEYTVEFPEEQTEACSYNQGFMVCLVRDYEGQGVTPLQIYTLEVFKRQMVYREILNRSIQNHLYKHFAKFTGSNLPSIEISKVLFYNDDPDKMLLIVLDYNQDGRASVHEVDLQEFFMNGEFNFTTKFILNLDFDIFHRKESHFFILHNHKFTYINRAGDIYANVYDMKYNKHFKIPILKDAYHVTAFQYNHAKNLLVLSYEVENKSNLSIVVVSITQDRLKQKIAVYHSNKHSTSVSLSTYKIFDKYLLISTYNRTEGNLIQLFVLNLKGAYVKFTPNDKFATIQGKQYPIEFESIKEFNVAELKQLKQLKIDRKSFEENDAIKTDSLFTTQGNIKSYKMYSLITKGGLVQRLTFQDPFVENDLKSADAFDFSCNYCFIQDNVLINKNNQNLQFTIQIIDLQTKQQKDIETKDCDDFSYSNGNIFCFVNELVGTSIYKFDSNEVLKKDEKKGTQQYFKDRFQKSIQFQGRDYYYLDLGETQETLETLEAQETQETKQTKKIKNVTTKRELVVVVHQQQSQLSFVTLSKYQQQNSEDGNYPYSLIVTERDFTDQQFFVNKLYLADVDLSNGTRRVNVYVYDSVHNQIKIIDIQFQHDLENAQIDTMSFDLDVFEKETYGCYCYHVIAYNFLCNIIGKFKVYTVAFTGQSYYLKNFIGWDMEKRYEYYITLPFYNPYNYNPIATQSKKYFLLTNRTSFHTQQSIYVYHKQKEPYVKFRLQLGQNCIVYDMKVIEQEGKEQLIVVFEYQGVGLQIKYFDITNDSFIKLDPNFDYLNDNYKFKLDIEYSNGVKKTLDIEITDQEKIEKHSAILLKRKKTDETSYLYAVIINTLGILMLVGIVVAIILKERKNRYQLQNELEDNPLDISQLNNQIQIKKFIQFFSQKSNVGLKLLFYIQSSFKQHVSFQFTFIGTKTPIQWFQFWSQCLYMHQMIYISNWCP